jgi:5-methylcytosine-specific restriction endonuclease McrA
VREVEQLVSGRVRGDRPSDEPRSCALRHVLRFEVSAETLATFREAMKHLCQASGERLHDDASLLLMARHILGGSRPGGAASYQVINSACPQCGKKRQQAAGDRVEIDPTVFDMVCCDARHVTPTESSPAAQTSMASRSSATHVGDAPPHSKPATMRVTRATQTIPPALRRRVVDRDQGRCVVPGCRHAMFVDVHHVQLRSDGGKHALDNLVVLCAAHHRASHRGQLIISGRASTGLHFSHADGTTYGGPASAAAVAVFEQVFRGLRNLGFRERDARSALERVRARQASAETDAAQLLRAALAELVKPTR